MKSSACTCTFTFNHNGKPMYSHTKKVRKKTAASASVTFKVGKANRAYVMVCLRSNQKEIERIDKIKEEEKKPPCRENSFDIGKNVK